MIITQVINRDLLMCSSSLIFNHMYQYSYLKNISLYGKISFVGKVRFSEVENFPFAMNALVGAQVKVLFVQ